MKTDIRPFIYFCMTLLMLPATLPAQDNADANNNPVVSMKTSEGEIQLELFQDAAPKTVKNFIDLAEGRKEFTDPETDEKVKRPYYDGVTFHRVIPDFMIQGGDPLGTGSGGPGYTFEDEINGKALGLDELQAVEGGKPHPWLLIRSQQDFQRAVVMPLLNKLGISSQEELTERQEEVQKAVEGLTVYDVYSNMGYQYNDQLESRKPVRGVIAMANSGPNTNGSQFFITVADTPHLTGKHTVFGKVIEGMDVVDKISQVDTGPQSKPVEPVTIESLRTVDGEAEEPTAN